MPIDSNWPTKKAFRLIRIGLSLAVPQVTDRRTLSHEDLDTLVDLLSVRPLQLCLFLTALSGEEQMEKMMLSSVEHVKMIRANRRKSLGHEPELGEE